MFVKGIGKGKEQKPGGGFALIKKKKKKISKNDTRQKDEALTHRQTTRTAKSAHP